MKKRILVVDDEFDLCEILRFNLEAEGYDVDVAFSGEEALERDLSGCSLILLDVMMDSLSGFDVAKHLRNNPKTKRIPIVFLTARTSEDDMLEGFGIGADDYIKKPFSVKELLARVKGSLKEYRAGNCIMTDDKAPVELLGMQVIDEVIRDEIGYYKDIFKKEGIQGLLNL